jgi:hypothetical protein
MIGLITAGDFLGGNLAGDDFLFANELFEFAIIDLLYVFAQKEAVQRVHHQDSEHDVPKGEIHPAIAERLPPPRFLIFHNL